MRQTKEKEIDGIRFSVQQLPAMRGVLLMHKLARAVGPAMLKALSGAGDSQKGVSIASVDLGGIADSVGLVFDRFSASDLEALIKELFETATLTDGANTFPVMQVFDNVLAGKTSTIFKAIRFALEVNYQDFLGALAASVSALGASQSESAKS